MDPFDILKIIRDDLIKTQNKDIFKKFDFNNSLIAPEKLTFIDGSSKSANIELWTVFDENTDSSSGYLIVFDDKTKQFGLAVKDKDKNTFVGYHGSFIETLLAM